MTTQKMPSSALAIASVLGIDYADMRGYRYQSTRTTQAIYNISDDYYAAGRKPKDQVGGSWEQIGNHKGKPVWRSKMIGETV